MRNPEQGTRHHLIPKSRGGTWDKRNIVILPFESHKAVHLLFGNDLPFEIIRGILNRYKSVIDPSAYHEVSRALRRVEGIMEAYRAECYHREILTKTIKG